MRNETLETTILLAVVLFLALLFFRSVPNKLSTLLESTVTEKSKVTLMVR